MKSVLVAFHLFMIFFYMGVGGILIFTSTFDFITGSARTVMGIALILYSFYRAYNVYNNVLRK